MWRLDYIPKGNKFLIVENDADDALLIKRALQAVTSCGPSFVCRSGSEARAYLKGAGHYGNRTVYPFPNVIITDLRMDNDSGTDLVEWVRQQGLPLKVIPIIILTGSASDVQFTEAEKGGADKVYRKPVKLEDLQTLLSRIAAEYCPSVNSEPPK